MENGLFIRNSHLNKQKSLGYNCHKWHGKLDKRCFNETKGDFQTFILFED